MLIMGEKENDAPSLHCVIVFLAYDFEIADFLTPAGPYIHSKQCCCDQFIRAVQAVMSSMCCIQIPLRQLDLYDLVTAEL